MAQSHLAAVADIENKVSEQDIDCGFTRLSGYLFPHDNSSSAESTLQKEYEASRRVGLTGNPCSWLLIYAFCNKLQPCT